MKEWFVEYPGVRFVADERSNLIIWGAPPEQVELVAVMLPLLDRKLSTKKETLK
jgi:hypothetical protein